jgi:acyl-CoA synthetase (AMP-forming)/AMP-acid ligase II
MTFTKQVPIQLDNKQPATLNAQIQALLEKQPAATALIFITRDDEQPITTREFFEQAARYAHALREAGVQPGDLVVLVLQHSLEVLYSFWGAIMLGAVPSIFPFLTEKLDPERYFASVRTLIERSGVRAVITYRELHQKLDDLLDGIDGLLPLLLTDDLQPTGDPADFLGNQAPTDPAQTAFLQHSSGSTGLQKGVMLSHEAVLNQLAAYSEAIKLQADDIICSWLPLYHDMGLIAGFIMPVMQGIPLVLMSPFHWVRAPHILLEAIQRHGGTLCWLPNFAYNFMALRIRDQHLEGLDLSSVRALVNCSEPVKAESHAMFLERFQPFGFKEEALATCYAMAENTFAVTQAGIDELVKIDVIERKTFIEEQRAVPSDRDDVLHMVSCGRPIPHTEILVVNEQDETVPERQVGEIILRGSSMLSGYYERPDATQESMKGGWFYTGDMGYLAEGELYVTGRKKDLIIIGGKNIYPQDVEMIVGEIEGVKDGRTVAFGVFNEDLGTEDLAVIAEVTTDDPAEHARIQREARQRIVKATDVMARFVHLVEPMWLHKTSSGKIARVANKEKFMREVLERP